MKTTIVDLVIYWFGVYGDNGKENGKYYNIFGLYIYIHTYILVLLWDKGSENGSNFSILRLQGHKGKKIEKNMETIITGYIGYILLLSARFDQSLEPGQLKCYNAFLT